MCVLSVMSMQRERRNKETKNKRIPKKTWPSARIEPTYSEYRITSSEIPNGKRTHIAASQRERVRCYRNFRLMEIYSHSRLSLSKAHCKGLLDTKRVRTVSATF